MKILLALAIFLVTNVINTFQLQRIDTDDGDDGQTEAPPVTLTIIGTNLTLENGLLSVTFGGDASGVSLYKGNQNLIDNLNGYNTLVLDYYSEGFKTFSPSRLEVVQKTKSRIHVAYIQDEDLYLEYHLIMESGLSGLYNYVIAANNGTSNISISELRTVTRFDPTIMTTLHNGRKIGKTPTYAELSNATKVQDETWKLEDGTYYTKYDFADYIRERNFFGVIGGGYGGWILTANHDYHSGGPLKQDLLVHQDSLMLNYLTGAHFGTPDLIAPPGWSKMYGPWLVYINEGTDEEVASDAQKQAEEEKTKWPYLWVDEPQELYPLLRTTVTGSVLAENYSMVVLCDSIEENFDDQTLGYLYFAETDESGTFTIPNVRPGTYKLSAYRLSGYLAGIVYEREVIVTTTDYLLNIGNYTVEEDSSSVRWAIGEVDKRASEFHYSKEERNYIWHTLEPANLTFTIGESDPSVDWYYAQTVAGTWTILFQDESDELNRTLTLSFAGATKATIESEEDPTISISINGAKLGEFTYENDKAVYRGALQSGSYHLEVINIDASLVKDGENEIELNVISGAFMYDAVIYS